MPYRSHWEQNIESSVSFHTFSSSLVSILWYGIDTSSGYCSLSSVRLCWAFVLDMQEEDAMLCYAALCRPLLISHRQLTNSCGILFALWLCFFSFHREPGGLMWTGDKLFFFSRPWSSCQISDRLSVSLRMCIAQRSQKLWLGYILSLSVSSSPTLPSISHFTSPSLTFCLISFPSMPPALWSWDPDGNRFVFHWPHVTHCKKRTSERSLKQSGTKEKDRQTSKRKIL